MEAISISRLCRLVAGALPSDLESLPSPLTIQAEKNLLLSLSRVHKEIRQWKDEPESKLDLEILKKSHYDKDCSLHQHEVLEGKTSCLADITLTMVNFVGFKSRFVQHLAGNIIVAISDLLSKFGSTWILFLHFLWIRLEASLLSMMKSMSLSSPLGVVASADDNLMDQYFLKRDMASGAEYPSAEILNFINLFKSRSFRVNGQMVAGLFRILYNILKLLKHEYSDLEETYIHLAISSLVRRPWNLLVETHSNCTTVCQLNSDKDALLIDSSKSEDILLGTILQFLGSLIQKDFKDVKSVSSGELPLSSQYTDLVLKLLMAFSQHLVCFKRSLSLYLRHKLLMLMIRLSSQSQCCGPHFLAWLNLLKHHFGDLLYKPILKHDANCATVLDESPFFSSFIDGGEVHNLSTQHLRRQAIFIFFKCCFKLVCFHDVTTPELPSTEASLGAYNMEGCNHIGAVELFEWFYKCASLDKVVDSNIYTRSCCGFAQAFLQLYMEEDDMLFDMLLQLLDAPFIFLQIQNSENNLSIEEMKTDIVLEISRVFNPMQLFHLFLLLLHYDHLVLVDYLISKDSGTRFLQYLLRCLRMICRSWDIFVGFSVNENDYDQPCFKRRKIIKGDCRHNLRNLYSLSEVANGQKAGKLSVGDMNNSISIGNIKDCLVSLRRTVEHLDQKNAFPYKPQPLLRSLNKFEELCKQHGI